MSKIIQDSDIENLKALIRNRNSYLDIKNILDNLEDYNPQVNAIECSSKATSSGISQKTADILKDLKELLHKGIRSQIHEFEIRDIINKYAEEDGK